MKTPITFTLAVLLLTTGVFADETHNHAQIIPGPHGGRILEVADGHAEFFVRPDKKVSVTFYDEAMQPVAPAGQEIAVIAEAPTGKAKLGFEKTGDAFLSTTTLPEGEGYRIVLQIRTTANAKPRNFRIDYHTEICGGCQRAEYACICAAESGGEHGGYGH